jgi:uncharacterized membrane protein (UPF0127 family)
MKKIALIIVLSIVAVFIWYKIEKKQEIKKMYQGLSTKEFTLEGKKRTFLLADTPAKWEKGLMFFRTLPGYDGMIFVFPDKKERMFWNKNTYMDLNLYWIDDTRVVNRSFLPSIEKTKEVMTVDSKDPVNIVIEMSVATQ